jgi:Ca2+:H+ antiporter
MDLVFTTPEILAIGLSIWIAGQISGDGESNWLEGVQLLAVYLVLAMTFYFLPEASAGR